MAGEDTQLHRRGVSGRGHLGRLPAAGAAARSDARRARQRRGRRRRRSRRCSTRYDELNAKLGEDLSPEEMDKVLEEQGTRAGPDRRGRTPGTSTRSSSSRWTRCAAAARRRRHDAVGRRAAPRRALPAAAAVARPAAARRADQPPRRRVGRLARALPQGLPGHGRRGHARSLLPRQRRRLDSRARSRPRHSVGGQLLVVARAEAAAARAGREGRDASASGRSQRELEWIRMSPRARQAKGKARLNAYEQLLQRGHGAEDRARSRSTSRPVRASATSSSRRAACARATATSC